MKHLEDRFATPTSQPKSLNLKSEGNQKSARRSLEGNLSDYIVDKPKQNKKNKKGRRSDPILVQQVKLAINVDDLRTDR